MTVRLLAATALALFLVGIALGHVTARASRATVIPASSFHPVVGGPLPRGVHQSGEEASSDATPAGMRSLEDADATDGLPKASVILEPDLTTPVPRASVEQPAAAPLTVSKAPKRSVGTASVTGTASWFCGAGSACTSGYPDGLYAAAGPALRVGNWRGRMVTVCASACVSVTLIDWCGCPGGRVIDLYRSAFSRLASPSAGTVRVTVNW